MKLIEVLKSHTGEFGRIVPIDLNSENVMIFNFGADNKELANLIGTDFTEFFYKYTKDTLEKNNAIAGIGKYNENRIIYLHSSLFGTNKDEIRTMHLGIDIFMSAGTKIFCPLNARIHSFQNNNNIGDYGPTIILEHELDTMKFYTLYGHLSNESLRGKIVGMKINKGDLIGEIGNEEINGNWPEHVHFQIISDMEVRKGDFPGVASIRQRKEYLEKCPDPNLILGIKLLQKE